MSRKIYIVGGGRTLQGYDFGKLKGVETIAVNVSALDVPDPTYSITADSSILRRIQEGYFKNVKTTWVLVTNPNHCTMKWRDGRFVHKNGFVYDLFCVNIVIRNSGVEGMGLSFDNFRTGYNSGFCAFQLAVLLGYDEIHLLGFDLSSQGASHYHDRYGKDKRINDRTLDKYYRNFVVALKTLKEKRPDVRVVSRSSISRLNEIIPYEKL